jgi:RimJ/RimL family protein N-acetyltransferase
MITTERLVLRPWRAEDREPYAAMMIDPRVGDWLGGGFSRDDALTQVDRFEAQLEAVGVSYMAMERRADGVFLGAAGVTPFRDTHPLAPGFEVGWRLTHAAWGNGYAAEAARAVLTDGFERLALSEILACTAVSHTRSRAVMERLGLRRDESRDFDHPALAVDHPLRRHVVYTAIP